MIQNGLFCCGIPFLFPPGTALAFVYFVHGPFWFMLSILFPLRKVVQAGYRWLYEPEHETFSFYFKIQFPGAPLPIFDDKVNHHVCRSSVPGYRNQNHQEWEPYFGKEAA